jgi:hypothetical protein
MRPWLKLFFHVCTLIDEAGVQIRAPAGVALK